MLAQITVLTLFALGAADAQSSGLPAGFGQSQAQLRASFDAAGFMADYSNITDQGNDHGSIRSVTGTGQPALYTLSNSGITQGVIVLEACALWSPHYHPRANEILYVTAGPLNISFAEENPITVNGTSYGGRVFNFFVKAQNSVIVPQGLIHHIFNPNCYRTSLVTSFDNKDPGSVSIVPQLFGLNPGVVSAATGLDSVAVALAKSIALKATLVGVDQDCMAKCNSPSPTGAAPTSSLPASATTQPTATAG